MLDDHDGDAGLRRVRGAFVTEYDGVRYFGTNENNALFEDADASPSAVAFDGFPSRAATNGTAVK